MQEKIVVENFGGITKSEIDLKKINIFIGPQASGKSVLAKLIYFFKEIPEVFRNASYEKSESGEFKEEIKERFNQYFPKHTHSSNGFKIKYDAQLSHTIYQKEANDIIIESDSLLGEFLDQKSKTSSIDFEQDRFPARHHKISKLLEENLGLEEKKELIFIPAGRVLFASLQANIYSFLNSKINIDPFLIKFGQYYQDVKSAERILQNRLIFSKNNSENVLAGKYVRENDKDYLMHKDGRKINISYASSGQQESLPLVMILNFLQVFIGGKIVVFIEEPEAHLFPSAQKKIVELIAATFNANPERDIQFVITTHSPYILTSFNNLIQAGQLGNTLPQDSLEKLYNVVPQNQLLHIEDIAAYAVADGTVTDIIDKENNLIDARIIDEVSNDIAIQFDSLLDLQ